MVAHSSFFGLQDVMFYSFCFLKSCQWIMEKTGLEKSTQQWSILSGAQGQLCIFETKQLHGTIQPWHLRKKPSSHAPKGETAFFQRILGGSRIPHGFHQCFHVQPFLLLQWLREEGFHPHLWALIFFFEIHRYVKKGLYWKTVISRILCSLIHLLIY